MPSACTRRWRRRMHGAALDAYRWLPVGMRRFVVRRMTPSYTVGAVLVLRRDPDEVLLVRQRHTGKWALPGGLLDRGEDPLHAVEREVSEELRYGVDAEALARPTVNVDAAAGRVDVVYEARVPRREQTPRGRGPEILDVGWFALSHLPDVTGPTGQVLRLVR